MKLRAISIPLDYIPLLEGLSFENLGKVVYASLIYANTGIKPILKSINEPEKSSVNVVYSLLTDTIDREKKHRAEVSEARRIAGLESAKSRAKSKIERNRNEQTERNTQDRGKNKGNTE